MPRSPASRARPGRRDHGQPRRPADREQTDRRTDRWTRRQSTACRAPREEPQPAGVVGGPELTWHVSSIHPKCPESRPHPVDREDSLPRPAAQLEGGLAAPSWGLGDQGGGLDA